MSTEPVLIAGQWRASQHSGTFQADDPAKKQMLAALYPISTWADCDAALAAAVKAQAEFGQLSPERRAEFLEAYATKLADHADELCAIAHQETALPVAPRLKDVELVRTIDQLRQAAAAARDGSWAMPTIDTKPNIRSYFAPIGPVIVFGPNNFPFAYNGVAGGDFAAAIAAGNVVIGKANTSHPGTSRMLAELAQQAAEETGMPRGTVQLLYRTIHADGERLVADPRTGAIGYTGARVAGLKLKGAADAAGKPIYLELSSINPVVILPGALAERAESVVNDLASSCLMAVGQFCTSPGLMLLVKGESTDRFIAAMTERLQAAPVGTLLSKRVGESLGEAVRTLQEAGAKLLVGGNSGGGTGHSFGNTILQVTAAQFLADPEKLQTEAFGNVSLYVVADDVAQMGDVLDQLEGNLTGSIYSATEKASGYESDAAAYGALAPRLRPRVGRLLNDKMPTGVGVVSAMNHGGPYPATGHPGFTAVGFPASIRRFAVLQCFDNVRHERLPLPLQDKNPTGTWRWIDGTWSQGDAR